MDDTVKTSSPLVQIRGLLQLIRPRQWIKNAFVLMPLLFSGTFMQASRVSQAFTAMVLFCVASSAAYIVNDLHDIEQDRRHPRKSLTRPLASGAVTLISALFLLGLLYAGLILAWFIQPMTLSVIVFYLGLNLAYSVVLKHEPVIDIFTIALGFVLRVYAGAVAIQVPISAWMFVTTLCLALYLAAVKRRQELAQNGTEGRKVLAKYSVALVDRYAEIAATGTLIFYSLFVMSERPLLVITIPLVLFGLFRYWYVVEQLEGGESPSDAVLHDWQLFLTTVAWVGVCIWALWPKA